MKTAWTDKVDPNMPLPEYPRPQLARHGWMNLNGLWDYAINDSSRFPKDFDGQIVVPFSPEAPLSGVNRQLKSGEYLWYRRAVAIPGEFSGKRIILHFGAVDQTAAVWVNSAQVANHTGGYLPFEADVTDAIENGYMLLTVRVSDDTDKGGHTRGKQKTKRGGIWYTPQSGIWQTVWIEAVPECYVKALRISPLFDEPAVEISAEIVGDQPAYAQLGGASYALPAHIPMPGFEAWTPEHPKLYGFTVSCGEDRVQSYFAMRKFSVEKDGQGTPRLFLNGAPYFHNGLLDQGYWPDGLYTAPTDEAMVYDIGMAKSMGFNMLRKHIKVEPLRWYYHCDRLGMLVWQDMPNGGGSYGAPVVSAPLATGINLKDSAYALFARADKDARAEFRAELAEMIEHLYNCPCIAMWVLFNEGWGQFDAAKMYELVRGIDKSRTIDHASGWHDQGIGKVRSEHVYFRKFGFKPDKLGRAVLLSEFGGYSHSVSGHCWGRKEFGYKKFEMPAQLEIAIEELYQTQIGPAKLQGLAAAVYTQLTDVEDELNGILTYDRKVAKVPPEIMAKIVNVGN
ncbi:MAG: glycoside hydrolase family 2 TIM barrel-domain containing protein [Oscillospiraceae bacterium]|nr:glycoside hydrolase family 2 TIM barrel-domain containing protein [Oscillospiraceae bacterium]